MSPLRISVLSAFVFGCSTTKPTGEDTGPESSGFADGTNFDEATTDEDLDFDGGTDDDGTTDADTDADADDGGPDDTGTPDADADADAPDDDTGLDEDTATETLDTDGGTGGGDEAGDGGGSSGSATGGSTGGTSGAGTGGTTGSAGTDGSGGTDDSGGTDGSGVDAEPTFIPEHIYIQWTASFQDGLFADTLFTDPETGTISPNDNFISFLVTTAAFDAEDASSFCLMQFYIDEAVPTDFDTWTGWDDMAFELDTTVGALPPSPGCAGMAAAIGIEDPVSEFLATYPWAFGYGPMKATWADELAEVAEEDFTSLGDAAGTVHLRYSDEVDGLTEWGFFEVNPYDSDMLVDSDSVTWLGYSRVRVGDRVRIRLVVCDSVTNPGPRDEP